MTLLYAFDYQAVWDAGDRYLNRYNDGYFGGAGHIMLSSSLTPTTELYKDYALPAGRYARFVLDYKILTYARRRGKCRVLVQLLQGADVIKQFDSGLMGDWQTDDWHPQQVADTLPANVDKVRFKVVVDGAISNNALTFRDITIRVGES